jgi:spore coat polysaccharide biosynthesis protein SpsF (cytidylyltransferase family)
MHCNIAILLARLDSTRLPQKHLKKIGVDYLITHCLNRLKKGGEYNIVLATSDRDIDNPLEDWAIENNISIYRGDAYNLKNRIAGCLKKFNATSFARVNADSPFVDANLIDKGFKLLQKEELDLVTNLQTRSYPYGYSVEVFRSSTFVNTINDNPEQENVTSFFYDNPSNFKIKSLKLEDKDYSNIRLTVDTPEDLEYIKDLYRNNTNIFNLSLEELINVINSKK